MAREGNGDHESESFDSVQEFVCTAITDPDILAEGSLPARRPAFQERLRELTTEALLRLLERRGRLTDEQKQSIATEAQFRMELNAHEAHSLERILIVLAKRRT